MLQHFCSRTPEKNKPTNARLAGVGEAIQIVNILVLEVGQTVLLAAAVLGWTARSSFVLPKGVLSLSENSAHLIIRGAWQ